MPEGYAYYGRYPEAYLEAAKDFHRIIGPRQATCRQQRRRVFEFFCDALNAYLQQETAPSLLR